MSNFLNKKTLADVDLKNKTVIIRVDFNVPLKNGVVTDPKRITAAIPTLKHLIDNNCKIIALSHLSRIKTLDDIKSGKKSLAPVAKELQKILPNTAFLSQNVGQPVKDAVAKLQPGHILLLENTRYNDVNDKNEVVKLESKCNPELGKF
jgi:phosphoglycerate kinase